MSLEYIRNYYKVPAFKGHAVTYKGNEGTITGSSGPHVAVRLAGKRLSIPIHPKDPNLEYDDGKGEDYPANEGGVHQ